MPCYRFSAAAAALVLPCALFAADRLDPLLVTATGHETALSALAPSIEVISREDIERLQPNDLADLLRGIASLDVVRTGGPGSPASVFLRGTESNHVLFLIDGVRYTTETFLNAQIQNLAPELIERIEIVKGPRSALYGSDAIGGVIHIITRAGQTAAATQLRGGSYGTREAGIHLAQQQEGWQGSLNVAAQRFDGFPPLQTGDEDRGHENLTGALQLGTRVGPLQLKARHLHADGTQEYVDFAGNPTAQDFQNQVSALELELPTQGIWSSRAIASHARDELVQAAPTDPARPELHSFTHVERRGLEWRNAIQFDQFRADLGLSSSHSRVHNVYYSAFGDSHTHESSERHGVSAQLAGPAAGGDGLLAVRYTDHDAFGAHWAGNLEWGTGLWSGARLAVLAGTAFKEPELTDLHGAFGNPDLEPERSRSYELNLRQAVGGRQAVTLAAFHTRIHDLIAFDMATFRPGNIERARIDGLELGWRYAGDVWFLRASGSLQDPENEADGQRLLRRSAKAFSAEIERRLGPLRLSVDGLAQGSRRDIGDARLAGYGILNAGLGWRVSQGLSIDLRGENLLDKDYELADGYRSPGRSGYLSLRTRF